MRIYVASSWRNEQQPHVVRELRSAGFDVYDFTSPWGAKDGFHWSDIDPGWKEWTPQQFRQGLEDPVAVEGFQKDLGAMQWADACVLVMPCGRSAHLEAGWFIGAGKPCIILLADGDPELMYRLARVACDLDEVIALLREGDR